MRRMALRVAIAAGVMSAVALGAASAMTGPPPPRRTPNGLRSIAPVARAATSTLKSNGPQTSVASAAFAA